MIDILRDSAERHPDACAVEMAGRTVSYAELDSAVDDAARRLTSAARNCVGLCLDDAQEMLVFMLAGLRAGLSTCPISPRLPARAIDSHALIAGADVVVTRRAGCMSALAPEALETYSISLASEGESDVSEVVVFTSGSTGAPKAAVLASHALYLNALGANYNMPLEPGDRWLLSLPLSHVGGIGAALRTLIAGATLVIPDRPQSLPEVLGPLGVTHVSVVSTQLLRLLRASEEAAPASIKAVLAGGGPLAASLLHEAHSRGYPVRTTYGLTEMGSQVTTLPADAPPEKLTSAGRVLPYRELRISGDGEVLVRGPVLFMGYRTGASLALPVNSEGWFRTGDLGRLDADGYLHIIGRRDNMFVSGGENIHPEEIERALVDIAGVDQAVVVPVPDAEFGSRPVAFVRARSKAVSEAALQERLAEVLPRYKIPRILPWLGEVSPVKADRRRIIEIAERMLMRRRE